MIQNGNNKDFEVRQATISDKESIWRFLDKAYHQRSEYKYPERWNWEYIENYYWKNKNLPIWIALHNNEIIGQTCAMYVPLKIKEKLFYAAWSVDTFVLPDYRGKGIGKALQNKSAQNHEIFMSLRSSEINRNIKAGFGSLSLANVAAYVRWVRVNPDSYLRAVDSWFNQKSWVNPVWRKLYNVLNFNRISLAAINFYIRMKKSISLKVNFDHDIEIAEIKKFPTEVNDFWKLLNKQFEVIVVRDKKYLNWKYASQPHMNYRKFIARKSGITCGILVLRVTRRPEPDVGIIAEILTLPDQKKILRQLLSFAINFFGSDVEAIKCATSVKEIRQVLKEFSFSKEHDDPFTFFSKDNNLMQNGTESLSDFFFSIGDHDYDQYPLQELKYKFGMFNLDSIRALNKRLTVIRK